ncbi:hypothetical protein C8R45DRAFT_815587 [Mycena sanguinolenta]|nr:hypothetical protein C8R45DRAFT_815587 [Mycena sanguinolenta]
MLSSLPSNLSIPDRARFVIFGTSVPQESTFACIHHAFSYRAKTLPRFIAAEYMDDSISYEQLDRLSSLVAMVLKGRSVMSGQRVCLVMRRSITMLVGLLGVLKSGASYVPLDGGIVTDSALRFILEDSAAPLLLYMSEYQGRIPNSTNSICIESIMGFDMECLSGPLCTPIHDSSAPSDEAYVIYTSGTTGAPKGVCVRHENVTNLLCLNPGKLNIRPGTRVAQLLNVAFDMCAWEVWGCLMNGGTLCIRGTDKNHWVSTLKKVDVAICTPTILQAYNPADFPSIRCVATAGEPCSQFLADSWAATCKFYNSCGPTETTIVNTMCLHQRGDKINIGRPTPNNRVYILDSHGHPVPTGTIGVMWASGAGVSSGYVNRPELTSQRYILDPFAGDGFMFNTGDLGCWTPHGNLEHHGRIDDQVKVKGFRVELDGIAAIMENCPNVSQAVVLLVGHELCGFVYPQSVDLDTVKLFTAQRLPYYSVPTKYFAVDTFPKTSNGKVDKLCLRRTFMDSHHFPGPSQHHSTISSQRCSTIGGEHELETRTWATTICH